MNARAAAASHVVPLCEVDASSAAEVGVKARALGTLMDAGVPVVDGLVVTAAAYRTLVDSNELFEVASREIARRRRRYARAEEYWDSSQRIRSAFISAPWPQPLREELLEGLSQGLRGPVALRSSAVYAASAGPTLMRMHDSLLSIEGESALLAALKVVWASLFSDRALLYSAELGLDQATSAMAVLVQPMITPRSSAIVFTRHPLDPDHAVVEVVAGSGERFASSAVKPYRWVIDPATGTVVEQIRPAQAGEEPLAPEDVTRVWQLAAEAERIFGEPQACEVAIQDGSMFVMETRRIHEPPNDDRRAYLGVRLPESRLESRRARIETEYLPSMWSEANALSVVDVPTLTDQELEAEALRRAEAVAHWRHVYRTVLAPFAHGQRLLGEYHVRMVAPSDPFAFIELLVRTPEEYEQRRQIVAELGIEPPDSPPVSTRRAEAEAAFFAAIPEQERPHASRLLDLARASWRIRDDDNLYLDRIESEARRVLLEIERRLFSEPGGTHSVIGPASRAELTAAANALRGLELTSATASATGPDVEADVRPKELLGDPAGPGVGHGRARVALDLAGASALQKGDVLVVDSLDPGVAAYAARASAIVERRGGMFAHGAVLAREHGLPCVTGIDDATRIIRDGERLTVDGDRGAVVLEGD